MKSTGQASPPFGTKTVLIHFDVPQIFVRYLEIGFLAQSVGGNVITGISFPPIIYFGGGIAF